jgi:hypothetical protein
MTASRDPYSLALVLDLDLGVRLDFLDRPSSRLGRSIVAEALGDNPSYERRPRRRPLDKESRL